MKKIHFVFPILSLTFVMGISFMGNNRAAFVKAESGNYDSWDYPDRSYILVEPNGTPVEVTKKNGGFDFVPDSDNASYLRYIIHADAAMTGSVTITNAWPTSQWNTVYLNSSSARADYNDSGNFTNTFNGLSFNAGDNAFIINMHYTYGISGISVSDGLTVKNVHIPDEMGETYYANNLVTEYARLYYKDTRNNIFDPSFALDRVIPDKGHPLVFNIENNAESEYFLDLSSWSSASKTIKYKIDNGSYNTVTLNSYTEDYEVSVGNVGSGSHTVTVDTDENTPRVAVRKLYTKVAKEKVTVTFNTNGGSSIAPVTILKGALVNRPDNPTKAGHVFAGWYKNSELTQAFDFANDVVNEDITLYAKWAQIQELGPQDIENNIYVGGRHRVTNDYLTMDWSLSSLEFDIDGGGDVIINYNLLSNSNGTKFAVVLDHEFQGFKELSQGEHSVKVIENLDSEGHTVEIYKTSQASGNLLNIKSMQFSNNATISKVNPKDLNIEVIGDSIAASETFTGSGMSQNAYYGFGRKLKDAFNANVNIVATSGIGLYAGYDGGTPTTQNQMGSIYDYDSFYRDNTALNASKYVPDIIVISLGNNDLGAWIMSQLGHSISTFTNAVRSFNSKLHTYYPNAKIIWAYGGFINRSYVPEFRSAVEQDEYASFVYLPKFGGVSINVDDHPSEAEYSVMADYLSTEITRLLNEDVPMQYRLQNPLLQRHFYEAEELNVVNGNTNYSDGENWSNGKAVASLSGSISLNVNLTRSSTYKVRVGGTGSNGNIPLYIDDKLISDNTILNTSNWCPTGVCKDYVDITVDIPKGDHTIKIGAVTNSGWINHDYIEIIEVEQLDAEGFYQEFMMRTERECGFSVQSNEFSSDTWSTLKMVFNMLDDSDKDIVVSAYSDLVERYTLIVNKYHLENFLTDSHGTPLFARNDIKYNDSLSSVTTAIIITSVSVILITFTSLWVLKKKRGHN